MASHYISAVDECAAVIKLVITAILGLLLLPLILTSLLLNRSMQRDDGVPFHPQTNSHNISVHTHLRLPSICPHVQLELLHVSHLKYNFHPLRLEMMCAWRVQYEHPWLKDYPNLHLTPWLHHEHTVKAKEVWPSQEEGATRPNYQLRHHSTQRIHSL